jgi:hypothetical protein
MTGPSSAWGAAETPLRLDRPPSLRRFGPATLRVEEQTGLGAPIGASGYHLRQGCLYTLRVWQPLLDESDGEVATVTALGGELLSLAPPLKIASGADTGNAYSFRPRLGWILPARSQLTLTVASAGASLLTLSIPVVIWPSFQRQSFWAVGLFFTVASTRYLALIQGPEGAPLACLARVATDFWYLLEAAAVALGLLLCLRAAGLFWLAWGGPRE